MLRISSVLIIGSLECSAAPPPPARRQLDGCKLTSSRNGSPGCKTTLRAEGTRRASTIDSDEMQLYADTGESSNEGASARGAVVTIGRNHNFAERMS